MKKLTSRLTKFFTSRFEAQGAFQKQSYPTSAPAPLQMENLP